MKKSLLVHIGTGKTGSTAIKQALGAAKTALLDQGVHYWGLNLEGADKQAQLFPWQQTSGTQQLQKLSVAEAGSQVRQALERALAALPEQHLAVWSNESIYERPDVFIPAIQEATTAQSASCTVICYVRSHGNTAVQKKSPTIYVFERILPAQSVNIRNRDSHFTGNGLAFHCHPSANGTLSETYYEQHLSRIRADSS
jgi:hypothetical protein